MFFVPVLAAALVYFLFSRRQIDFYTLAFFSCAIYFLPSLLGFVWHTRPVDGRYEDVFIPIDARVQLVHTIVVGTLLVATLLYDRVHRATAASRLIEASARERDVTTAVALSAAVLYAVFLSQDLTAAMAGKKGEFGRFYALAAIAVPFAFTLCVASGRTGLALLFAGGAMLDVFLGNREPIVFGMLSATVVVLWRRGPIRLIWQYHYIAAAATAVVAVMAYKNVAARVRLGDWPVVIERLTNVTFYFDSVLNSEPFVTQSILHYAMVSGWSYEGTMVAALLASLVPFGNVVFGNVGTISAHINTVLFENVGYGVASNVWAEAYMYGRWPLVVVYAAVYSALPAMLGAAFRRCRHYRTQAFVSVAAVVLLFYLQRSGVDGAAVWIKRLVVFYVLGLAVSICLRVARARMRTPL